MFRKLLFRILNYFSERRLKKEAAIKRAKMIEEIKKNDPFIYPNF